MTDIKREAFEAGYDAATSMVEIAGDHGPSRSQRARYKALSYTIDLQRDEVVNRWLEREGQPEVVGFTREEFESHLAQAYSDGRERHMQDENAIGVTKPDDADRRYASGYSTTSLYRS